MNTKDTLDPDKEIVVNYLDTTRMMDVDTIERVGTFIQLTKNFLKKSFLRN